VAGRKRALCTLALRRPMRSDSLRQLSRT
jgi:hypothetical protein